MSAKTKTIIKGSFEFNSPYVPDSVSDNINELVSTSDIVKSKKLIEELIKIRTDKKWYLWVLISYKCEELAEKLKIIKESLG